MKRFALVILLLFAGTVLLWGADLMDYATRFSPTRNIAVSTTTPTALFSVSGGNRRDWHIENDGSEAETIYIGYDVNISTYATTVWELHTTDSLTFEFFTGTVYGIAINTTTVSIYELTYE